MKAKITTLLLTLAVLFSLCYSAPALAADTMDTAFGTSQEFEYEIIDTKISDNHARANYRDIEITVVHQQIVVPPSTVPYTNTFNGLKYSGTLSLYSYAHADGKTYAYYRGRIYVVNI